MRTQYTPEQDDEMMALGMAHVAERLYKAEQQRDQLQAKYDELADASDSYVKAVHQGNFVEIAAACFALEDAIAKHRGI